MESHGCLTNREREGHLGDERDLISALQAGREEAFEALVKKHQSEVYYLMLGMLRNHGDADEVTQKTFINVFRKIKGFRGDSSLRTWIMRIAMNLAKNHIRDRGRRPVQPVDELQADPGPDAQEMLEDYSMRMRMKEAISMLPDAQREVVTLRTAQSLSFSEIAEIVGSSPGTARVNFHHAVKRLRRMLATEEA